MKFLDCCLLGQLGQDHREGSNSDEITVFPLPGRYHLNRLTIKTTTTTNMMVHYHELECLVERFYCCVQGQGHSRGSCFHVCPDDIF